MPHLWRKLAAGGTVRGRPTFVALPMNAQSVVSELKGLGSESYKRVIMRHGIPEPCFGVKISELKKIQKRIKCDYRLANDLYRTGIYDAMYLAGLIADDQQMSKEDLDAWVGKACDALAGSVVAWVASGSAHMPTIALEWIDSEQETVAVAGWASLRAWVSITPDAKLDLRLLEKLLADVGRSIHRSANKVRYQMNGFVISVGTYVAPLTASALRVAESIGAVSVDMGETACQVPSAPEYLRKVIARGAVGKKRRTARC